MASQEPAKPGVPSDPRVSPDAFEGTPYRTLSVIGTGGMSDVYSVCHRQRPGELVAKLLRPELAGDARLIDRVRVEAESLMRLDHPNIVSVVDFGCTMDQRPYIVMERLSGSTLGDALEGGREVPLATAFEYARSVLRALSVTHAIGIVHRDIKPQNLFLHEVEPGVIVLKVLDFGVARVLPDAPSTAPSPLRVPTDAGLVMGSPRFVSPEAAIGERADTRADLYGVGLVLYLLVAGRGPFDHYKRFGDLLLAHASEPPAPPSHYAQRALPQALDAVVLKALAKQPAERYQTADEFATALAELEGELLGDTKLKRAAPVPKGSASRPAVSGESSADPGAPRAPERQARSPMVVGSRRAARVRRLPAWRWLVASLVLLMVFVLWLTTLQGAQPPSFTGQTVGGSG